MTTATLDHVSVAETTPFQRLAQWAKQAGKSIQYSQMLRALALLDDSQLARLGIDRTDIPAYAHRLIYRES